MTDTQSCPRRMKEMGPWEREENLDAWRESGRVPGLSCSFCGSLHPERFLELITEGWVVEPTDKTYKAYLGHAPATEERSVMPGEPLPPVAGGRAKFYYQHFSDEQQQYFIDLYNSRQMHIANPGYFYVLPFFLRVAT